jgi:hypothetical protein
MKNKIIFQFYSNSIIILDPSLFSPRALEKNIFVLNIYYQYKLLFYYKNNF